MNPELVLLHCPHNYWQEVRYTNHGDVIGLCRNKKCQASHVFTIEEWNALGEAALNKPVRV
jgi:hypothetical protein